MIRTVLVTGAASGIGEATAQRCEALGHRVIRTDIASCDIAADFATGEGRTALSRQASELAPDGLDSVIACAGWRATPTSAGTFRSISSVL